MPYSNIVFVKLFLSLFEEDDRFLYQLNESQQLLYIKMLYLAGSTQNKITKNLRFIIHKINYHHEEDCLKADIKRIREVFPKFNENNEFYYFDNFEELHNYIIGKSKGNPKEIPNDTTGIAQNKNKKKNKKRIEEDKEVPIFEFLNNPDFSKVFNDYLEMRKKQRKPATERAKELVLNKLHKVDIKTAIAMLEQSIVNSWQDVYELKNKGNSNLTKAQKNNLQGLSKTIERIENDKRGVSEGVSGVSGFISGPAI